MESSDPTGLLQVDGIRRPVVLGEGFPILSRDPFRETLKNPEETDPVVEKNDG